MDEELLDTLEDMGAEVEDTLDRLGGDEELYLEYLHKLPEDQNIVKLREAVEAGDSDGAMRAVHTLKGMALNLGLLPLMDDCMDMLLDFRAGENEKAFDQLEKVEHSLKEWTDVILKAK